MKFLIVLFFVSPALLLLNNCDSTDPKLEPDLKLELKDISCTEAWLQFSSTNIQIPNNISLLINGSVKKTFNLNTQDSLLYIDSLLPNQSYKFKVVLNTTNNPQLTTNEVLAQTMDTTSHNFTWQTFEFGVITNQSHLFDVAIINENNIWAVGEIYMNDSLGNPDPNLYNLVKWDGFSWKTERVYFRNSQGQFFLAPMKSIFAFSTNDIWIGLDQIIHWNGTQYISVELSNAVFQSWINKIWGSSSNDLYIVGSVGNIAHYGGSSVGWKKIESGTSLFLSDIAVNDLGEIFICDGNTAYGQGILLKSTNGNNFSTFAEGANIPESQLFNPKLYGSFSSIWFDQNNTLYSGGNILFQNKFSKWSYVKSLPENFIGGNPGVYYRGFIDRVRGTSSNNMWIVGDRNTLRHFNGVTWQQIGMPYDPQIDLVWRGMACKDNNTVIVGSYNRSAIIMMIKK